MWWLAHQGQQHIPLHLDDERLPEHLVLAPAVADDRPRLYVVGANVAGRVAHQRKRLSGSGIPQGLNLAPRFFSSGTGGSWLAEEKEPREKLVRHWRRRLLSLSNNYDQGRVSEVAVADVLAELNLLVHEELEKRAASSKNGRPASVGPNCVVLWLSRPHAGGPHEGVQFYKRAMRTGDGSVATVTSELTGRDLGALLRGMTHDLDNLEAGVSPIGADGPPFIPDNTLL